MTRWPDILFAAALVFSGAAVFAAETGDATSGEKLFKVCKGCHEIGDGARNRVGPQLNMLFGRKAAGLKDFRYSKSMTRAGTSGVEWHADTLSAFLENPRRVASDTAMSFRGMKDVQDRDDLIAYLRLYSDDPQNIPEADPTARGTDHSIDPTILAIEGDPEYGEYLASECTTCHQVKSGGAGIPSIVRWPEDDFVLALHAYKDGVRKNPTMQLIAKRLNNEEIAALAAYFKDLEN